MWDSIVGAGRMAVVLLHTSAAVALSAAANGLVGLGQAWWLRQGAGA